MRRTLGNSLVLFALLLGCGSMPADLSANGPPAPARRVLLGHSVEGRPIIAIEVGDRAAPTKLLVVGCIHGNEPAGIPIALRLEEATPPAKTDIWIVPNLNPDGTAAGTRGNAHGVDLNRNFPWHWRQLGAMFDSGPHPLSEPESRLAYQLIRRLRPTISIWFHQHLSLVDQSGGPTRIAAKLAGLLGLPLLRLPRYSGSVTSWQNANLPGTTAIVVELPAGRLATARVRRYANAVLSLAR